MPIGTFILQPIADSFQAAYRPIIFRVSATRTDGNPIPPVVYCDIYFNDIFYKTLSKSQYSTLNAGVNTEWQFDIQDAAQEYLGKYLADNGHSSILEATPLVTKARCFFRSSGFDSDGFITHEGLAPIQGTGDTPPVGGTGTGSNTFYIVNATLQHEDIQSLSAHLQAYKIRTWTSAAYPLSHRPDHYRLTPIDTDSFPIIYTGAGPFKKIRLKYRNCGQLSFNESVANVAPAPTCNAVISQPTATQNSFGWLIDWNLVSGNPGKYFIQTPAISAGAPGETTETQWQLTPLPVGEHIVTVTPLCFIEGEWYTGTPKQVTLTVEPCVNVGISGSPSLPDAYVDVFYSYEISLTGTAPFTLSNVVKPSWMSISILGSTVTLSGTPTSGDAGTGINVSFTVENCSSGSVPFSDTIDVLEELTPLENFTITNQSAGWGINNVNPAFYFISGSAFPVNSGETETGTQVGFTGDIGVSIINSGLEAILQLIVNSVVVDEISVPTAGGYFFEDASFVDTDNVEIKLITA